MRMLRLAAAILTCFLVLPAAAQAQLAGWGVVVLHGKGASPWTMSAVDGQLQAAGAVTSVPTMFWSDGSYRTYDEALAQISAEIANLKAKGARRIALVGHSLGANVALGYAANRPGIAAVVAMGPGHQPQAFIGRTGESLARAKAMVAEGRGAETAAFVDLNQGRESQVNVSAAAYVSFFDPNGQANMMRTSGRLKGARLLWVVGTGDPGAQRTARGGTTIVVPAGHRDTPQAGAAQVAEWLASLR